MTVLSADGTLQCEDERRSGVLRDPAHPLNGIDFVEFRREPRQPLHPRCDFPQAGARGGALRISRSSAASASSICGSRRSSRSPSDPLMLRVLVDREGDFSPYVLETAIPRSITSATRRASVSRPACPSEFDCRTAPECPPPLRDEPALDYLAKDYQSFRRLMVDLIAERNPAWQERLPADLGMTLVELLAYAGDYLSYFQDAGPGTEGYLDTCLHRISAARHAPADRLCDAPGAQRHGLRASRRRRGRQRRRSGGNEADELVAVPLVGAVAPPSVIMPASADFDNDPALAAGNVFELKSDVRVLEIHNELRIHTWGDRLCCLSKDYARPLSLPRQCRRRGAARFPGGRIFAP